MITRPKNEKEKKQMWKEQANLLLLMGKTIKEANDNQIQKQDAEN